jgi:hypothetical protein
MKTFNVCLNGLWSFDYLIEANTKEEAISQAIKEMDLESGSIDLEHVDQYAEEEKDSRVPCGPGPSDMKISSKFFYKIMTAVYEKEELEAPNNVGAPD